MNEIYLGDEAESPRTTEERAVIRESREAQQGLKREVKKGAENIYKRSFRRLNFFYKTSNILEGGNNIIKRLIEKFKDDDSLEGVLFNNPQVRKLISNIVSSQAKDIRKDKLVYEKKLSEIKKDEVSTDLNKNEGSDENEGLDGNEISTQDEPVESWEDYKYNQTSVEAFEDFILSDEGISVIVNEVKRHINEKTGEIYPNYPISEDVLKLRLKNAWDNKLHREYNEKFDDPTSDEEKDKFDRLGNILEDGIDSIVGEHIKNGGKNFDRNLINNIELLISEKGDEESLNKDNDTFKEVLRGKIKNFASIVLKGNRFSLNTGNKQVDLQLRSYLFMYGKIFYPDLFKTNQGEQYYEGIFPKIMGAILKTDGYKELEDIIKQNEFLEQERKAEEARRKRDEQKRREIAKKNRERNSNYTLGGRGHKVIDYSTKGKSGDLQEASGAQIAERSNLNLGDFKVNTGMVESITKNEFARSRAFSIAWKNFINSHSEIAEIVTDKDMRKLYDIEKKTIDETAWEEFLQSDIMKGKSPDEISRIHDILLSFSSDFENILKQIASQATAMEGKTNDKIRNYAIGSVIDNVRFIFADIVEKWRGDSKFEGFRFDGSEPVKRKGNDIIISGTFNGADIKIRYDLLSGGLFMNSFLHHLSPSKVSIGNNTNADFQIGQLESFSTILDKHYRAPDISSKSHSQIKNKGAQSSPEQNQGGNPGDEPKGTDTGGKIHFTAQYFAESHTNNEQSSSPEPTHDIPTNISSQSGSFKPATSEVKGNDKGEMEAIRKKYRDMLDVNLDMISNSIINHTKRQSSVNSAITKFMTTFNIISPSSGFSSLDFNDGSNLFDVIQIIERTADPKDGDIQSLEYFNNTFMPVVMEYSGLKWGKRNDRQDKEGQKSKNIFSYNGDNEYINCLKNKTKDFNPEQFSGVANFESQHQLGFVDLIKEKIITGKKPDWKLNAKEMKNFVNGLEGKKYSA